MKFCFFFLSLVRLPITLWGYDAEWDGMKFNVSPPSCVLLFPSRRVELTLRPFSPIHPCSPAQPTSNEHSHAKAFLKDYGDWLQQKKIQTLPTQVVQERGLQGVLKGLEEVQVGPISLALSICIDEN